MISVPDYLNEGVNQFNGQLEDLDRLEKAEPTQLEMVTDTGLNIQWHELMSEEEELMRKLGELKLKLADYQTEMNRRIFRRTIEACITAYDTVAE